MIKLYTKNNCLQCEFTKKYLDNNGIEYTATNVEEDERAFDYVKNELGMTSMPVVEVPGQPAFSGFRPDLLAKAGE